MTEPTTAAVPGRRVQAWLADTGEHVEVIDVVDGASADEITAVANLTSADLTGANLYKASLVNVTFFGANLTGTYLHSAQLQGAYLSGAYLTGTYSGILGQPASPLPAGWTFTGMPGTLTFIPPSPSMSLK